MIERLMEIAKKDAKLQNLWAYVPITCFGAVAESLGKIGRLVEVGKPCPRAVVAEINEAVAVIVGAIEDHYQVQLPNEFKKAVKDMGELNLKKKQDK